MITLNFNFVLAGFSYLHTRIIVFIWLWCIVLKFPVFILALLASVQLLAQNQVSGILIDESDRPVSFASVLLLDTRDSTLVKGEISSADGTFNIVTDKNGTFFISASAVGFQEMVTQPFRLTGNTQQRMPIMFVHRILVHPLEGAPSPLSDGPVKKNTTFLNVKEFSLVLGAIVIAFSRTLSVSMK